MQSSDGLQRRTSPVMLSALVLTLSSAVILRGAGDDGIAKRRASAAPSLKATSPVEKSTSDACEAPTSVVELSTFSEVCGCESTCPAARTDHAVGPSKCESDDTHARRFSTPTKGGGAPLIKASSLSATLERFLRSIQDARAAVYVASDVLTGLTVGPCHIASAPLSVEREVAVEVPAYRKPRLLRLVAVRAKPSADLAAMQRTYRKLLELGLDAEAAEISRRLGIAPADQETMDAAGKLNETHHLVGYRSPTKADWNDVRKTKVSFHFAGSSLDEVAAFFRLATGMHVRVQCSGAETPPAGVHAQARDKPVAEALGGALESCGLSFCVHDGELVIAKPAVTQLLDKATPLPR